VWNEGLGGILLPGCGQHVKECEPVIALGTARILGNRGRLDGPKQVQRKRLAAPP